MNPGAKALLNISRTQPTEYIVRPAEPHVRDAVIARDDLRARLLADGAPEEIVGIRFVGDVGLDELFVVSGAEIVSLGWEGLLVPYSERRKVPLPRGCTVTADASRASREELIALHRNSAWILDSTHMDLSESMLLHRDGELIGWVPVWRFAPSVSVIRQVCISSAVHADEERRRTFLRLALYAQALKHQGDQGRTVLTWLPDDGDPVNELKISVTGALASTHWMRIQVRRDLDLAPATL